MKFPTSSFIPVQARQKGSFNSVFFFLDHIIKELCEPFGFIIGGWVKSLGIKK